MIRYLESTSNYAYLVNNCDRLTCNKIRDFASEFIMGLDDEHKDELFEQLKRGTALLNTEPQMTMYIYAYCNMHVAKLNRAYDELINNCPRFFKDDDDYCLIDYGCGQGLATIAFVDYMRKNKIHCKIDKVILIDGSKTALSRAALHVSKALPNIEIETVCKTFDDLEFNDIYYKEDDEDVKVPKKLHLFSNVLDMNEDDSQHLAEIIREDEFNYHCVVCCSPLFGNYRDDYMDYFEEAVCYNKDFHILYDDQFDVGEWPNNEKWTAKIKVLSNWPEEDAKKCYFDLDDAMSVNEFFKINGVNGSDRTFIIKTCHPEKEGQVDPKTGEIITSFRAVGFANGETTNDGHPAYTFFILSRELREKGEVLNKAFLKAHKEDLQLLEPVDGFKFGICFLSRDADDWEEV